MPEELSLRWLITGGPGMLAEDLAVRSEQVDLAITAMHPLDVDGLHGMTAMALGMGRRVQALKQLPPNPLPLVRHWQAGEGAVGEWGRAEAAKEATQGRNQRRQAAITADTLRPAADAEWAQAHALIAEWTAATAVVIASAAPPSAVFVEPLRMPISIA